MKNVLGMLKGENKKETLENYSIALIILGGVIMVSGIGLSTFYPKGLAAILAMLGSFIAFVSTIMLIISWLWKDWSE